MSKKIFAVLGLGLFGTALARTLHREGHDVIAMDKLMDHVEEVSGEIDQSVQGDFTKLEHLKEAGVGTCDTAIVATSSRLEDTILAILNLQKLNVKNIIVKTKNREYSSVLQKLGADRVILPEIEMAIRVGRELSDPTYSELIDLNHRYNMAVYQVEDKWQGQTINDINFRQEFGVNIIAIKPAKSKDFTVEFDANYILEYGDELLGVSVNQESEGND